MKDLVLKDYPNLDYMFQNQRTTNWTPDMDFTNCNLCLQPQLHDVKTNFYDDLEYNFEKVEKDSVDLKHFVPENMNNNLFQIGSEIEVSLVTMAQDHRHRTLKRTTPRFTGNFYLSPVLSALGLEKEALDFMDEFMELYKTIDKTLAVAIAPYGAMVRYKKIGDINAVIHEQEKRLCWSAQEEIYNLSRQLYDKLKNHEEENCRKIANLMLPPCYNGACIEGRRYCMRDIAKLKSDKNVPNRRI
jgi:hypothetical protein